MNDSESIELFRLTGDLPAGRLAIEASAGTGKTFTLAALTVRILAETDISATNFLIVTFTRAATAELRGRIRDAIVEAIAFLDATVEARSAGQPEPTTGVEYLTTIAAVDPVELSARRARLAVALTEYDAITITTIHSFAVQTVASLGATSALEAPRSFAEDDASSLRAVAADSIARMVANGMAVADVPKLSDVTKKLNVALRHADMRIEPSGDNVDATSAEVALAAVVRDCLDLLRQRRAARGEVSLSESLTGLRDVLRGPSRDTLIAGLRSRYQVALIDEFQDTDPVQWEIFETLFGDEPARLVLVGDPKQAIYGFRGADVDTYVAATTAPNTRRAALGTNWRSDGRVLAGLDTLLHGTTYGPGIHFVSVQAAHNNVERTPRFVDRHSDAPAPVEVRLVVGEELPRSKDKKSVPAADAERAILNDVVEQVLNALDPDTGVEIPTATGYRLIAPNEIAILVAKSKTAERTQQRLIEAGVPAVLSRSGDVLASAAAEQWRWLLDALDRPADPARARRFALSWFGGMSIAELDTATDANLNSLFDRLASWLHVLREHGTADFVRTVFDESAALARVLTTADGDRAATDLQHLGELFQTEVDAQRPSPSSLLAVLESSDLGGADIDDADVAARRVETEEPSVQIMTIWVSKGLEFPVVMCPDMYSGLMAPDNIGTDETGTKVLDVSKKSRFATQAKQASLEERMRLMYVALTRGRHQTMLWWAPTHNGAKFPLSRLLFGRTAEGDIDPDLFLGAGPKAVPNDPESATSALAPLVERSAGMLRTVVVGTGARWQRRAEPQQSSGERNELEVATLSSPPSRATGRWSFSAIVAAEAAHRVEDPSLGDGGSGDEGHETVASDDDVIVDSTPHTMPLGWLPAGAHFGTLVHSLFERADFAAADVDGELRELLADELAWRDVDLTPRTIAGATHAMGERLLIDGLAKVLETPLGPLFDSDNGQLRLADIDRTGRLDELNFELLLRPHDDCLSDREIGDIITRWLPDGDRLSAWANSLASGRFNVDLRGHLTGSIDAIFRVRRDGVDRYIVSDYKTNRLASFDAAPRPTQYLGEELTEAMGHHHYPLQALLYSVALHRYLRSRITGYDPDVHLGGVAYLFVRGMVGADTPIVDGDPAGVWSWRPPSGMIIELSDALAGISAAAQSAVAHQGEPQQSESVR